MCRGRSNQENTRVAANFVHACLLAKITRNIFIPSATQQDLQALLDQNQYDQLFASFNIRNRARLTALSLTHLVLAVDGSKLFLKSPLLWLFLVLSLLLAFVCGSESLYFHFPHYVSVLLPLTNLVTIF